MSQESFWPSFSEQNINSAKEILEQQAKFLPNQTNNLIYAEIEEKDMKIDSIVDDLDYDLGYKFLLKSKLMDRYKFEVFSFYHDITLFPVFLKLDPDIKTELGWSAKLIRINTEEEFNDFLRRVFNSNKVSSVVGALMKLSK